MRTRFEPSVMSRASRHLSGKGEVCMRAAGFTLIEVVISTAIVALVFGGVITAYIQSGMRVQWSGYSLAAQSLATEVLEQAKSGVWDPAQAVPVNNLTNLNLLSPNYNNSTHTYTGYSTAILDVPYAGTNFTLATNYVTVQLVYVSGVSNVQMQFVRCFSFFSACLGHYIRCVWVMRWTVSQAPLCPMDKRGGPLFDAMKPTA